MVARLSAPCDIRLQALGFRRSRGGDKIYKRTRFQRRTLRFVDALVYDLGNICARDYLSSLKNIEISLKDNNTYISFKENIDQYQDLDVEIQLTQDQDRYKIIKWQEVTSKEWKNESTLPLLGSE